MEKFRARKFKLLAYPDSNPTIIDDLKSFGWSFVAILHDKDKQKDGSIKKAHYHIFLQFSNACFNTSIIKQLKIDERFVRKCESMDEKRFLAYLLHFGSKDKHKYDFSELLFSSDKMLDLVQKACDSLETEDLSESDKALKVLDLIRTHGDLTLAGLLELCCDAGLYDVFRRNANLFIQILKERCR